MPTARWNDHVLAQSDDIVSVEGNAYFPAEAIDAALFEDSDTTTVCPWKGTAHYNTIVAGGVRNVDAAWYYPDPKPAAAEIAGRFAFWKGVVVA